MQIDHIDENMVRVTKTSALTGKRNTMRIPLRQGEIENWLESTMLVQDAFPWIAADVREFLISGITPDEWDNTFSFTAISLDAEEA